MVIKKPSAQKVIVETFIDFKKHKVWGITPKNVEQEFALQLLMDKRLSAVSLAGLAGSGKNFLALAAALEQTFEEKMFKRIIITRSTQGSDEDIGFLPGTEEEKMSPWLGSLDDNLEALTDGDQCDEGGVSKDQMFRHATTLEYLKQRIQIKSLNFMKGRTIADTLIIIDEAQDLTAKKLKMISTRVGPRSKIVFLGNVAQIDDPYLTENTCGMSIFIRAFANSTLAGHVTLQRGERSAFATEAEERL